MLSFGGTPYRKMAFLFFIIGFRIFFNSQIEAVKTFKRTGYVLNNLAEVVLYAKNMNS